MRSSLHLLLCALLATTACRDLERFDTKGDAAYCGDLVSGPAFHDGFVADEVEPPTIRLKLTLDTGQLSSFSENKTALPGTLTSNDSERGLCSGDGQALFQRAPLRAIPQVYHDSISTLSFGEGHDEDFFAWADSTCQGTMLAVVSLLRSGDVEVRLFKPAPLPALDAGPEKRPGFALFSLKRHDKGCEL
ncbi:MAG TPA: hypothetical protein VJN18_12380 [Polyangiaceae bacterium]|nr:hypothetical protein [Polyangiaceae bacterium]